MLQVKTPLKLKRPQKACLCRSLARHARVSLASLAISNGNRAGPCTMTAFPSADSAEPSQPGGMDRSGRSPRDGVFSCPSLCSLCLMLTLKFFPPIRQGCVSVLGGRGGDKNTVTVVFRSSPSRNHPLPYPLSLSLSLCSLPFLFVCGFRMRGGESG